MHLEEYTDKNYSGRSLTYSLLPCCMKFHINTCRVHTVPCFGKLTQMVVIDLQSVQLFLIVRVTMEPYDTLRLYIGLLQVLAACKPEVDRGLYSYFILQQWKPKK